MKILFIDTVHRHLKDMLEKTGHHCTDASRMSREEVLRVLNAYTGIVVRSRLKVDKEFLDTAYQLRFIARAGAGMENIDMEEAHRRNIHCLSAPDGNRNALAEHAIAMILSLFSNLSRADRQVRAGQWIREENRGHEVKGKTIGIIGYGKMGSAFAEKLSSFGCEVIAYDKYLKGFGSALVEEVSIEQIFLRTDILSLHVPLTMETEFLINESFIQRFSKDIWIINTARGKCLHTDDLVKMMKSGKVKGACLDVLEYEDTSFEKFDIDKAGFKNSETWKYLVSSDRVILSPHIAGWSFESHQRISEILFRKISELEI